MNYIELAKQAGIGWAEGLGGMPEFLEDFAKLVAAQEREECANLCESQAIYGSDGEWDGCCLFLANKIRARGEA